MLISRRSMSPVDFHGLRIFDYTSGQAGDASIALIEVEPGARHAEAWSRRSDKYYLVVDGEISFVLDGDAHLLGSGDFCFVERGRHFSYSNPSSRSATLVLVHTPSFDLSEEVFVE